MKIGEYFARVEGLEGQLVSNDRPDLDYHVDGRIIGIEVTELVPPDSKMRLPGVDRVLERCKALHFEQQYPTVRCFVDFDTAYRIKKIEADRCAESLMEALHPVLQQFVGVEEIRLTTGLPPGVLSVSVRAPVAPSKPTLYLSPYLVRDEVLRVEHIDRCIEGKEKKLVEYRPGLAEYWLVILCGHLLGENRYIGPTFDLYEDLPINSKFDRVYLLPALIKDEVCRIG